MAAGTILIVIGLAAVGAAVLGKEFQMGDRTVSPWCGRIFFAIVAGVFIGRGIALIINAN